MNEYIFQVLKLTQNPLTAWNSHAFGEHPSFKRLEIGGSPDIQTITEPLLPKSAASSLQDLTICNMHSLESISPDALDGMLSLDTLRICGNPLLRTLPPELTRPARNTLQRIYLYNNSFEVLDGGELLPKPSADRELICDFTGNQWACNCSNSWLVLAMRRSSNKCTAANPRATTLYSAVHLLLLYNTTLFA